MNVYTDTPSTAETELDLELRPSSSGRWFACPGSVWVSAVCPPLPSTLDADKGTVAHWMLYCALYVYFNRHVAKQEYQTPETENTVEIDKSMQDKVHSAYSVIVKTTMWLLPDGVIPMLEQRVGYRYAHGDSYGAVLGTADFAAWCPEVTVIIDYKNGRWRVDPKNNTQLLIYCLSVRQMFGHSSSYWLGIAQPEVSDSISWWTVNNEQLDAFELNLLEALRRARSFPTFFKTGSHCHFCPGKAICPSIAMESLMALVAAGAKNEHIESPVNAWLLEHADTIIENVTDLKSEAIKLINTGKTINGYTLISTEGRRRWKPDIIETLKQRACEAGLNPETVKKEETVKPIGITEAEKLGINTEGLTDKTRPQKLVKAICADTLKGF